MNVIDPFAQIAADEDAPRLLPDTPLPDYTFTTGCGLPHPYRDPRGHSHARKNRTPKPLEAPRWAENRPFLMAVDYFNFGYYWESHDGWDRLGRVAVPESLVARFLRGLVKMAAAGLKVREGSVHGVRRHAAAAGEIFADVAAECGTESYCGLPLTSLQYSADRAAQLNYKHEIPVGKPIRVFPFALFTDAMPLG